MLNSALVQYDSYHPDAVEQTPKEMYSRTAEESVIGSLLLLASSESNVVNDIVTMLSPMDFFIPLTRAAFTEIVNFVESNEPYDMFLVAEKAQAKSGYNYLPDLIEIQQNTPSANNVKAYAHVVQDKAIERNAITRLNDALIEIQGGEGPIRDRVAKADSLLADVVSDGSQTSMVSAKDAMKQYIEMLEWRFENPGIHGLKTGLKDLDNRYSGWKPGELVVIAARPAMGKTTIATHLAANAALNGEHALFFSLEMPTAQMMQRLVASTGHIPLRSLKDASAVEDEEHSRKLMIASSKLGQAALTIDDTGSIDIADLRARARLAHRKNPVKILVVDYLQLLNDRTERDRFQVVSSVSRKLKALAKELNCVVVALSQLSRKVEERTDKRPMNSDLRESGQIEQDADAIIMLYRDEVYNEQSSHKGIIELITTKFRDGEIGTDYAAFIGSENRVGDLAFTPEPIQPPVNKPTRGFEI